LEEVAGHLVEWKHERGDAWETAEREMVEGKRVKEDEAARAKEERKARMRERAARLRMRTESAGRLSSVVVEAPAPVVEQVAEEVREVEKEKEKEKEKEPAVVEPVETREEAAEGLAVKRERLEAAAPAAMEVDDDEVQVVEAPPVPVASTSAPTPDRRKKTKSDGVRREEGDKVSPPLFHLLVEADRIVFRITGRRVRRAVRRVANAGVWRASHAASAWWHTRSAAWRRQPVAGPQVSPFL
jgi:hypothetical protein